MEFAIFVAISAVLIIGVLFLIARRALRFVVRLALIGVLLLFLLIGGLAWWWYGAGSSPASKQGASSPASTRPHTSR